MSSTNIAKMSHWTIPEGKKLPGSPRITPATMSCVIFGTFISYMWARGDLNSHALRHYFLRVACLPISPPAHNF